MSSKIDIRISLAFIIGFGLFNGACAAQRVVLPSAPVFPENGPSEFEEVDFVLKGFSVSGVSSQRDKDTVFELGSAFLRYVEANSNFANIIDLRKQTSPESKKFTKDSPYLETEVNIHVEHTSRRTWILDIITAYPFGGAWPITPVWGDAKVRVSAMAKGPDGTPLWTKTFTGKDKYHMIVYSWFRTKPIERAYQTAT